MQELNESSQPRMPHQQTMVSHSHPLIASPVAAFTRNAGYPADFIEALSKHMQQAAQETQQGGLMVLAIDNLAMIMSGYGHDISETVMQQLGCEILTIIGEQDYIQRIQRDQFGIILRNSSAEEIDYVAQRILSHIQHFGCYSAYGSLHIIGSVARICFPTDAATPHEALDRAFIALHNTLNESTIRAYEPESFRPDQDRQDMGLANYLSKALHEKRLKLAFQPIVSARDGSISHYEALLRLYSDDGKISSAGALIPIAERMGLIDMIDENVLELIVEELRRSPDVSLAFNVSNLTTRNARWLDKFALLMGETPEIASRCVVEITETAAQLDLRRTAYFVAQIQAHGAQVALDDFGSGYTSFRQLKTLSVDIVKIDGSFIKDLVDNADNRFFVKTLLDFTQGFGLKSVAEFVENGEIAKMLIDLGVDYLQGYYLGRPENRRKWLSGGEYAKD